jgi:hypothetical protein
MKKTKAKDGFDKKGYWTTKRMAKLSKKKHKKKGKK